MLAVLIHTSVYESVPGWLVVFGLVAFLLALVLSRAPRERLVSAVGVVAGCLSGAVLLAYFYLPYVYLPWPKDPMCFFYGWC